MARQPRSVSYTHHSEEELDVTNKPTGRQAQQ